MLIAENVINAPAHIKQVCDEKKLHLPHSHIGHCWSYAVQAQFDCSKASLNNIIYIEPVSTALRNVL